MSEIPAIEDVAKMLARDHKDDDPDNTLEVHWLPDSNEVRLVEVTNAIMDRHEVLPFRFVPAPPEVPYPSVIVLLSPGDWKNRRDLEWPDGYDVTQLKRVV